MQGFLESLPGQDSRCRALVDRYRIILGQGDRGLHRTLRDAVGAIHPDDFLHQVDGAV